jgi:hypothetical protein
MLVARNEVGGGDRIQIAGLEFAIRGLGKGVEKQIEGDGSDQADEHHCGSDGGESSGIGLGVGVCLVPTLDHCRLTARDAR